MNFLTKLFTLVSVIALAVTVVAQSDSTKSAGTMSSTGPPQELKELAFLVGEWSYDLLIQESPEAGWTSFACIEEYKVIFDGCGFRSKTVCEFPDMTFRGEYTITFNRNTNKWQSNWIDNIGAYQLFLEGVLTDGKLVLVGENTERGRNFLMRDITSNMTDTLFDWRMDVSYDKGENWTTPMKATYKRIK